MAGLKEIRNRIASVKSTRQITSAMKMVSAAKLKKSQDRITQIKPYAAKLVDVLIEVSSSLDKEHKGIFNEERNQENVLIVLMASNRGLCGAFNSNICKAAISHVQNNYPEQAKSNKVKFLTIGKKAGEFIRKQNFEIIKSADYIYDNSNFESVAKISEYLMQLFADKVFDRIDLVYNSFKNAALQIQTIEQFLPMTVNRNERTNPSEYIFEPNLNEILEEVIPKALKIQFFKAILDTSAAEHGARMTAMHQATDNATNMIHELTLEYNKARQAAITKEILEIVSGAEALKSR
ncbi:MAG: ATP synthase F1 subunit gamma [Bacteroidales bacterium]|jgi:F-type H+-transporting ATPase subunit gamma|nr:ATP synthase F1 subunit gamma [Flavobacterium piscis]HOK37139.1 ATP synthase F1 subunit gamma [Bacteroidales bacterium]HOL97308.1 ATP synthase F1 subunit gamma [Bacteroidales bacterium]HPD22854.1 ATP synthase F1 subunit gamma [Bacteroidales bacterium]HRT00537.1 ATP synthase F1 subunit gamma [Bacteroidales bacterium]